MKIKQAIFMAAYIIYMERKGCLNMQRHNILLIEDDPEISQMLKTYLTSENFDTDCAFDGEEACRLFDNSSYSLVLLDLMMPRIGGMDVMQHIRSKSVVPVIILSAGLRRGIYCKVSCQKYPASNTCQAAVSLSH